MKLIYVADPMCSWCYGFGKEMTALTERHPDLALEIITGGLRNGGQEKLDDAGKRFRLQHWARVEAASGLAFNREGFLARQGFVYNTEPICRAFVAARTIAPEVDLLALFRQLQRGFYVDALDTTDGQVLSQMGAAALSRLGHPCDAEAFFKVWNSAEVIALAQADFSRARGMGVQSFPALFLEREGRLLPIGAGYASVDLLDQSLQELMG